MARLNKAPLAVHTHEGGRAKRIRPYDALRRAVCSCFLWEREFYEDGEEIAGRVVNLVRQVVREDPHGEAPEKVARLAVEVRREMGLRHVPLLILSALSGVAGGRVVREAIEHTISRADEPGEFLAIHARVSGVTPDKLKPVLSAQVKRGVAAAMRKFDAYQLAKYDRATAVRLRDVIRLTHPKPKDDEQSRAWKALIAGELPSPDTWEVSLSAGKDKRETWERLLREERLGYMAVLKNLRNMVKAGVDEDLIRDAITARKGARWVLPFRYVAAARAVPQFEASIDTALLNCIQESDPLPGRTAVLVDVSGSMVFSNLSAKSDLRRIDAAAALASVVNAESLRVFTFDTEVREVPPRRGMAGVDSITNTASGGGTYLGAAVRHVNENVRHDRLIVVTDEQSHDPVPDPVAKRAYMVNVASAENGVGYGPWTHMDGFSESVLRFVREREKLPA